MPDIAVLSVLIPLALSWAIWRTTKALTSRSPLDTIPGPPPRSYLTGNIEDLFGPDGWDYQEYLAMNYPGVARVPSVMGAVMLNVRDPKALYHIILKDQHLFDESEDFTRVNDLLFGKGLLSTLGEHHRRQRKMLNPVFSVAHLRGMVPIFNEIGSKLCDSLRKEIGAGKTEIDVLAWMGRTALELIGQSGWGTSFDNLEPDVPLHPFHKSIKDIMQAATKFNVHRVFVIPYVNYLGTPRFRRFIVDLLPSKNVRVLRDIINNLHQTCLEVYESKKQALDVGDDAFHEQIGQGKDIISALMKANLLAAEKDKMPEEEIIAQMSTLTFAATDTTSTALSRTLLLLSESPEVQEKLREEIIDAKTEQGELLYDELHQLPYLDAVCRETLRLYPPIGYVQRQAKEDAYIPLSHPIVSTDGKVMNEVMVPRGTDLNVSIVSCNRDPLIWGPDAHEWKPERWLSPLPQSVAEARIPGVYSNLQVSPLLSLSGRFNAHELVNLRMTFVGGGRACIGFKFSQLEMKVLLSLLLESFKFAPTRKKIRWEFHGIAQPMIDEGRVEGQGLRNLQLPLKISLL
ncbi:cytochrome P450 [Coprinopsis marcescibilis]|uniref:Cytochrome P450 n=1 Tax=Coprinopsis marcescibilis TaxID=230819 RepID=A0A5C3KE55_COPMA|nr:cytochrome P450 [Coprinopsis marcescibilis]